MEIQMKDEENQGQVPPEQLTIKDPVPQEALSALDQLSRTKSALASNLADLELGKLDILGSLRRVNQEHTRIFESILETRGLPPGTQIEIDKAGKITVLAEPPK